MPDTDIDDTQGSSPALEQGAPDTGAAASDTQPVEQHTEAAATDVPTTSDTPNEPNGSKSVVEFFSGKKTDKAIPEKKVADKVVDPKADKPVADAEPKKPDDLFPEHTEQERKSISRKTEKRVRSLVERANVAETKLKEYEPLAEQGKVFGKIVSQFKLDGDLEHVEDAQVAGHIKLQAAINRALSKQATRNDIQFMQSQFAALDRVRERFGMMTEAKASAPAIEAADVEKALSDIKKDFNFDAMDALLGRLKAATKPVSTPQPAPPPRMQEPLRQDSAPNRDVYAYSSQLTRQLKSSGISDTSKYMAEKLWPAMVEEMRATFPSEDPSDAYSSLSGRAQFDVALRAHEAEQKKAEALKGKERRPDTPPVKPATGSKTTVSGPPRASSGNAAIAFFSGSPE